MILIAGELANCDDVASPHRLLRGHKGGLARKPLSLAGLDQGRQSAIS
jgi:hypothetical protein